MTEGYVNGMIGLFLMLNIVLVITVIVQTALWLKSDDKYKGNWFEFLIDGWSTGIVIAGAAIDIIVLICYVGYIFGNAIL